MIKSIEKDKIIVDKEDFNLVQTLECGQVFSYFKENENYVVQSADKIAIIEEKEDYYIINTSTPNYFVNYFDLNTSYKEIKNKLLKYPIMKKPISFGSGIRILKQDIFETIISFIVSANNNIKRITKILNKIRENFGKKIGKYYAFPTLEELKGANEEYFLKLGAGYRARYLEKVLNELEEFNIEESKTLPTEELRNKLISLSGVGPKVADCILLFAYSRHDVFPVDTWMAKMYNDFFEKCDNRTLIRKKLVEYFGELSGYAQQYLFYYKRSKTE